MKKFFRIAMLLGSAAAGFAQTYDLVLANGRVMDPESGLDAVRFVGIRAGRIAAVSATPITGRTTVDVKGLVVAPGFIDMHSHGQDPENYLYKAHEGVTTALELELGMVHAKDWYAQRKGKAIINFGGSAGHVPARMSVMHDTGSWLPVDQASHRVADDEEKLSVLNMVRQAMDDGAIGIGFGLAYTPSTTREEVIRLFQLASDRHVPAYVHMRAATEGDDAVPSLQELLADAAITGVSLHVVHTPSMCLGKTATCLDLMARARKHGMDVTTEMYPYTASASRIEAASYDGDWAKRTGHSYNDLQWVLTGERLTAETFAKYRKIGGSIINHQIPESAVKTALADPTIIIASDGKITEGKGHPRGAGTYSRVLGEYVREQKVLPLMEALRKMTVLPARRLESAVPEMKNKGRLKVGADADIVAFDAEHIIDHATFQNPAQYSTGVMALVVNGTLVMRDGKIIDGVLPGVGVQSKPPASK